jgi:hypothetical protein
MIKTITHAALAPVVLSVAACAPPAAGPYAGFQPKGYGEPVASPVATPAGGSWASMCTSIGGLAATANDSRHLGTPLSTALRIAAVSGSSELARIGTAVIRLAYVMPDRETARAAAFGLCMRNGG